MNHNNKIPRTDTRSSSSSTNSSTSTRKNSPELSSTSNQVSPERNSRHDEASGIGSRIDSGSGSGNSSGIGTHTTQPIIQEDKKSPDSYGCIQRTSPVASNPSQVSYSDYNHKVYTLSPPDRRDYSVFPSTPQYDPTLLDMSETLSPFFRSSPKVTPFRNLPPSCSAAAAAAVSLCSSSVPPLKKSSLPPPKYNMSLMMQEDSIRHVAAEDDSMGPPPATATVTTTSTTIIHPRGTAAGGGGSNISGGGGGKRGGLDQIIRASESTDFEGRPTLGHDPNDEAGEGQGEEQRDKDNTSTPRRNGKVTVVSPPEQGDVSGRRGVGSSSHHSSSVPAYEYSNVPDSPYGPPGAYPSYRGSGGASYYPPRGVYPYPPPGFLRNGPHMADGLEAVEHERYHHPPHHHHPLYYGAVPYGYGYDRLPYEADVFRAGSASSSLGKRKRMYGSQEDMERELERAASSSEDYVAGGVGVGGGSRPYYERGRHPYRYYRPPVSESFESSSDSGSKQRRIRASPPPTTTTTTAAAISKSPSYPPPPPPPSSSKMGGVGVGGDSSTASSYPGTRRSHDSYYHHTSPHSAGRFAPGIPPSPHGAIRYEERQGRFPLPSQHGIYARPSLGYPGYAEATTAEFYPPGRESPAPQDPRMIQNDELNVSPMSSQQNAGIIAPKEGSPSKARASTTAQAAIAAGMTEPSSAKEVDFDITAPPTEPIIPASTKPLCTSSSELNEDDVLCGRGGGTNTQIGNRKFRSLVQEFQPTYLLCRRKEKPLIARTIVLIVRKRGGRFLKKNEDDGTYFEVGDEKAEAKTCQALREGLDVRATRSNIDGKRKCGRLRRKKEFLPDGRGADISHVDIESPGRDGPPPPYYDSFAYTAPPPPYYYGTYDPYYAPPYDVTASPHSFSPRKRTVRLPPGEVPYDYHQYHAASPYRHHGYQYIPDQHSAQREFGREDGNQSTWEMEFSPPRSGIVKKQIAGENR